VMIERAPQRHETPLITGLPGNAGTLFGHVPFGYDHNLSGHELFSFDTLTELARDYDRDYFLSGGAPTPGTRFYSVTMHGDTPYDAIGRLDAGNQRILLKRPENYDPRYRDLMHALFDQSIAIRGGLRKDEHVVRLDSSILISSAATITPFHFDPEISLFFQIEGDKVYHLYEPVVLSEPELENFYWMGIVNIGQVDLHGREARREHVFHLHPGMGMHQPQNSPHWVETGASRSISYVFSFETNVSRAMGRTRAFNHYMRRAGLTPAEPGLHPAADSMKASAMQALIPLRKGVARMLGKG
jgi:hypothetical protein